MQDRFDSSSLRPTSRGRVVGLGLGKFRFVGSGVALLLAASTALAGPEGAKVREGRATITQRGNRTVIRTSDRAVIDYRSFDIGRNETVRFIQPGADSRVLNRIRSDRPTTIDGTIKANGRVYIVNPVGVIFSGSSVTDVAHLYAAAGNISNRDFMAGIDRFTGVTGDVTNQGLIRADSAALIGAHVANSGIILPQTENGVVAMVSGSEVTLTPRGSSLSVKIDAANAPVSPADAPAVENTGTINTRGGQALMAAGDLYALAIRNTGTVRARDVELRGGSGKVELSGQIDARDRSVGGRGGSVTVTGAEIALSNANIDASGSHAGGSVRIGGDAMGRGDLPHARTVSADSVTTITADALRRGD
ncbi:MAG: filamentous hemagglutinin N-terminal domain-containing protein, partial [Phycisphaerales bacterium]